MAIDQLSEVLDLIEVRGVVSGASAVRGRWRTHSAIDDDLKFIAVVRGGAILDTDGLEAPIELAAGDVAVLNGRTWLTLEGGAGPEKPSEVGPPAAGATISDADAADLEVDILIGGRVDLNPTGVELLLQVLPPVAHVGGASEVGPELRGHLHRLSTEISSHQIGSDFAIRQYGQLMVLDIIRGFLHDADLPAGWLRLLTDERLRPAVALIHEQPAQSWGLEDLARACSMSRSTFAHRFRESAGTPPLSYLINWRMLLAQRELRRSDTRIGTLATTLGYSSESAFSSAFKRQVGESPLAYRTRIAAQDKGTGEEAVS